SARTFPSSQRRGIGRIQVSSKRQRHRQPLRRSRAMPFVVRSSFIGQRRDRKNSSLRKFQGVQLSQNTAFGGMPMKRSVWVFLLLLAGYAQSVTGQQPADNLNEQQRLGRQIV